MQSMGLSGHSEVALPMVTASWEQHQFLTEGTCSSAGLGAGESVAETSRAGLVETSPPSAEGGEGRGTDFESPEDPAHRNAQFRDSLQGLRMPDDDDEAPDDLEATHLGPLAADSLEDLLRSDSRDRRSSEGPHGETLGRTAETAEAGLLSADGREEGIASLEAAADAGEAMQLSESFRSGQRLGDEAAAESDSGSLRQEREDAGLQLPASEYAAGVEAEIDDVLLSATLEGTAEMDEKDDYTPRAASDHRAELEEEELSLPLSAAADADDIWSEEDMLPVSAIAGTGDMDDGEAEEDSFDLPRSNVA